MKKVILRIISLIVCGAILLLCFAGCAKAPQKAEDFRVTAYVRGEFIQSEEALHPEDFDIITDVILFECASFDNKGEIVYDTTQMHVMYQTCQILSLMYMTLCGTIGIKIIKYFKNF